MPESDSVFVGVDLGATKTLAAVFDSSMRLLASEKSKTPREASPRSVVAAIAEAVDRAVASSGAPRSRLGGVGVAVPGALDRARGVVRLTPNMGFRDYPLGAELAGLFGAPAFLDNDVQAGVYGELRAGALRGARNAVGVFVGTGVGGGIVINGELYRGASGSAGEVGHMIVQEGGPLCGCGNYGCLEAFASRSAMAKDALALAAAGKAPGMLKAAGLDFSKYRSSSFEEAIGQGDKEVRRIVDRAARWLGVGLANLVHLFDPEAVVLGGGMAVRFGQRFLDLAVKSMEDRLMPGLAGGVAVRLSELGDLAVATGAAHIAADGRAGQPAAAGGAR